MVTSEQLLAFIEEMSKQTIIRDAEGSPEFANTPLEGGDLADAIGHVKDLCEIEAAKETADKHHEAHMKMHEDRTAAGAAALPLSTHGGHGNYN
jgi:hypothetical protein